MNCSSDLSELSFLLLVIQILNDSYIDIRVFFDGPISSRKKRSSLTSTSLRYLIESAQVVSTQTMHQWDTANSANEL